jgi:hypothetical protein
MLRQEPVELNAYLSGSTMHFHNSSLSTVCCLLMAGVSLVFATPAVSTTTFFNFTPYNCQLAAFDTAVHCTDGDTLLIANAAPSAGAVNYFLELNGTIIDTVSSTPGDTIWRKVVAASDSLISIIVWSMPGSCYGQRYTLLRPSGIEDPDNLPLIILHGHELKVTCFGPDNRLRAYSLSGALLLDEHSLPAGSTNFLLPEGTPKVILVILESGREKRTWKLSVN